MAKLKGHLFARLALDYFDHPKIAALSDAAIVAHLEMIVYCRRYLTGGRVPMRIAMRFASDALDELCANDPERPSIVRNPDGSVFVHDFSEYQESREEVEDRRRSAQRGAEARWGKDATRNAQRTTPRNADTSAGRKAETETETETDKELLRIPAGKRTPQTTDQFEKWWPHWRKKKSKGDAEKAFRTAIKKIPLPELIAKTDAYWQHIEATGQDHQFVPYPGKWLRAEGWADELPEQQQPDVPSYWK
ncbi:hypothetical protein M3F63_07110 [Brachybacterium muris]|uniref:hypothetical protein n=1 Tax=Brachybacterium muris TaxID=219301 RepID=UPI00223C33CA|nr:hypothetical protein [Brachybacterium muris]MCT2177437.1 hypothetical protein [Brachybacterium muris]